MVNDLADAAAWTIRALVLAGLCWGAWLAFSLTFLPAAPQRRLHIEHFATFALLVLLFSALGGVIHAG